MEINSELLASVLIPKAESTSKNRKRKNKKYDEQSTLKQDQCDDADTDETSANLVQKSSNWEEKDRRCTNDRRKKVAKRGRWLESRDKKDRRKSDKGISITI